jgi:hypothetical protein
MSDPKAPFLEPEALLAIRRARPDDDGLSADELTAVSIASAAITFKRLVDGLSPLLKMASDQIQQELGESKKGKRP